MAHDASIIFLVGRRNSGKSTRLEILLKDNRRCIVFAPIRRDFRKGFLQTDSLASVKRIMRRRWNDPRGFRIAYRPPDGKCIAGLHHLSVMLRGIQKPYELDEDTRQITLAVDEANLAFPHSRPAGMDGFKFAILQGRHSGINIIAATQRPALVAPDLRDNADEMYIFALGGDSSIARVVEVTGSQYKEAIRCLELHTFLHFNNGVATMGKNPPLRGK